MASVTLIHVPRLVHAEYADAAAIAPGSELLLLAGVCPLDENGATVAPGDVAAQMRQALANLDIALEECGAEVSDVANVRIRVATQSRAYLSQAWTAFRERFAEHDVPATLCGVTVLGYDARLVELETVVVRAPR